MREQTYIPMAEYEMGGRSEGHEEGGPGDYRGYIRINAGEQNDDDENFMCVAFRFIKRLFFKAGMRNVPSHS